MKLPWMLLCILTVPIILFSQGELSFLQEFDDEDAIDGGTVTELVGVNSITVSPDGQNVYVVSLSDNGVVVFDRAADGMLSLRQQIVDGEVIAGGTVTELDSPRSVEVSPDGQNVYVVSLGGNGVVVFDRAADGSLSFRQEFDDGDDIGGGTVTELEWPRTVAVSPDGQNVYVASGLDDGIVVFDRAADGSLSLRQQFDDGDDIDGGTVTELNGAWTVTVSPDGQNVYVVAANDHGVVVFDRAADGSLSLRQQFDDGDDIDGGTVTELETPVSITVSPNGKNVYVVSLSDHGVVVFDRDANGMLSLRQQFDDGDVIPGGTVTELFSAISIAVSPDGGNVYVVSYEDNGVVVFRRTTDGSLSLVHEFDDGDDITGGMVTELQGARTVAVSPDGQNVYVGSDIDGGVVVFNRARLPGACCFPDGGCETLSEEDCTVALGNYLGDNTECTPELCPEPIPTLSQWGLIILGLCFLIIGTVVVFNKRKVFV